MAQALPVAMIVTPAPVRGKLTQVSKGEYHIVAALPARSASNGGAVATKLPVVQSAAAKQQTQRQDQDIEGFKPLVRLSIERRELRPSQPETSSESIPASKPRSRMVEFSGFKPLVRLQIKPTSSADASN